MGNNAVMKASSTLAMSSSVSSQVDMAMMSGASQTQATPSQSQPEKPQLHRLQKFDPDDIPMDDGPEQVKHRAEVGVEVKWWARGEWVSGQDSDESSSNKPSDKSDCSMESLIDRVQNINLNVNLNDYFERRAAPSQHQGVKKHHLKQQSAKDTTQSVKITDFFTKKKPSK